MRIIFFVPIGRYSFPSSLPFELEPYRVFVAVLVILWATSLLIDRRVRFRATGFEAPIVCLLLVILASEVANFGSIADQGLFAEVAKELTFFLSFVIVVFAIASLVTTREAVDRVVKVLVGGAAIVAIAAIAEARSGYNVFAHLHQAFPILENRGLTRIEPGRGGHIRAYGSAQHPIALGAMLVMLVPLSVYLGVRTRQRRWWFAGCLLIVGSLATISRTSVLMLVLEIAVYAVMRPRDLKRLWVLVPVVLVVVQLAVPGASEALKSAFFPRGGLIAQQGAAPVGSGRVSTLKASLEVWKMHPLLGLGFGTRIVTPGPKQNAYILDNQWLGTLLELGIAGLVAWVWLFVVFLRRMFRAARRCSDPDAWLFMGLGAAIGSFALGMYFYDEFAFTQVTFIAFVLIALGAVSLRIIDVGKPPSPGLLRVRLAASPTPRADRPGGRLRYIQAHSGATP